MSRVGLSKLAVPASVKLAIREDQVEITAAGKTQVVSIPEGFVVKEEEGKVFVRPLDMETCNRARWGTVVRNLFQTINGLAKPFEKRVNLVGVGYKAALQGKVLTLELGYSHKIDYTLPADVEVKVEKPTELVFSSISSQRLGQVVSEIERYRKPEPYKGKGVIREGRFILRKEGKKK